MYMCVTKKKLVRKKNPDAASIAPIDADVTNLIIDWEIPMRAQSYANVGYNGITWRTNLLETYLLRAKLLRADMYL